MPLTAPNADIEFGIYSLADMNSPETAPRRIRDIVDYGVAADKLGLNVFGVGEHHTSRFVVSSPAVVLAAIAARTSSITLASAVSVLSVLDPVRLYQDFAQLDLVSGGRAEITAGRSAYAEPFDIFGVDGTQYDEVFAEKLDLLRVLTTEEVVTWEGRFRTPLDRATVIPRLGRTLPVRVGVGGSLDSARRAGSVGLPMTLAHLGGSAARAKPAVDLYWSSAEAAGYPLSTLGVGLASHLYVGATSQGARETFYPHYRSYFAAGRGTHLDRSTFDAMAGPDGALLVGSAHEIAEKIAAQHQLIGACRFIGLIDLGGLPRIDVVESIERFADGVAPAVRGSSG
ncbi:LLM class flavin-dependent oxidoreductase [Rhodococcus globerulus]|uniref:LLM class flavin-dependent oxidoreductase n=1 Tax=Rhodococcus globerulus TaxID=33008 RepID=A0ABU4C5L2_RHOGO|nr:LLM class flavin-dependent oxidoreductase [Rhodococcus globerulus]MDV6271554.1 LLM class flavin-dependent oxidoreductase [Rhodococcus globerulus]